MPCSRWTCGEIEKHRASLRLAGLIIFLANDGPRARFMQDLGELELARNAADEARRRPPPEAAHCPAGEGARKLRYVGLAVTRPHAQRVQLHDFACEILVEATLLSAAKRGKLAGARVGTDRLGLVQIDEHRRMLLDGKQHIRKGPEHVRADRLE